MRFVCLIAFLAMIPLANWLIGNVGTHCIPNGPCLVPVGFGLDAPSGVLVIGAALVLRDLVQTQLGARWAIGAIVVGAILSAFISPALALASGIAFLVSELADMAVYSPMREKYPASAVMVSGVVGAAIDSALFLWLAFGSLNFLPGQIVGKLWMSAIAAVALIAVRRARLFA